MKEELFNSLILFITGDESDHLAQIGDTALGFLTNEYLPKLNIPFISTVISIYKIGATVIERHHIRSMCLFVERINERLINKMERKGCMV